MLRYQVPGRTMMKGGKEPPYREGHGGERLVRTCPCITVLKGTSSVQNLTNIY